MKIVGWGYWGSVGSVTDAFYRKRKESLGFGSIEPDEAIEALGKRWGNARKFSGLGNEPAGAGECGV